MLAGLLLVGAGIAVLAWLLLTPWLRARRRQRLSGLPMPAEWHDWLERNVPVRRRLPAALRARLDALVQVFVAEKQFVGCDGLQVTDEMRVTIAAHACLLLLGRSSTCFDALMSILVYPTPFWVDEESQDDDGIVTRRRHMLSGQAWDATRVIVSWEDVVETIESPGTGYNVVLHEFAHHLDTDGAPGVLAGALPNGASAVDASSSGWAAALGVEYARFVAAVESGQDTFLDPYAAEDEAEFFAVATEEFLERATELAAIEPAVYGLLRSFYGIDPAAWTLPERESPTANC